LMFSFFPPPLQLALLPQLLALVAAVNLCHHHGRGLQPLHFDCCVAPAALASTTGV